MRSAPARPIALIGLMGSGKSSVASALGERWATSVADLDTMLEAVEGASISDLFEREGEAWFRAREADLLAQVLQAGVGLVACGGGIVLSERARALLRERCQVVWLEVDPATAAERVAADGDTRPLLRSAAPQERLRTLLAERAALYAASADARVRTDGRTPSQVADEIVATLGAGEPA